jgi:hypothetical protein
MKTLVLLVCMLLVAAMPLVAHHSFAAEYDGNKAVTIKGILKEIDWRNPHIYYYFDVKDEAGKLVRWTVEGYPPNMLVRRPEGWTRDKVFAKIGDEVTVTGWLARANPHAAHSRNMTFSDGSRMEAGPPAGTGGQ